MDDLQIKRIKILAEIDRLNKDRCDRCAGYRYTIKKCCTINVQIQALGMELLRLTKPKPLDKNSPLYRQEFKKWQNVAKENGIKPTTFAGRVNKGVPLEKAATVKPGESIFDEPRKQRTLSEEQKQIARENGLKLNTVYHRLSTGWSEYEAVSTPPDTRFLSKRVKATN